MSEQKSKKRTLVVLYPQCIEYEVMLAAEVCNKKYPVMVVTPSGQQHQGSNGMSVIAEQKLSAVDLDNIVGILIPGGDPYELIEGEAAADIAKLLIDACQRKIPIGAICAGPAVLGKHGLLKSRKFTHGYGDAHKEFLAPIWEDADFTDADIEVDGNILTAKPSAQIDFGIAFARLLGVIDTKEEADHLTGYYKNFPSYELEEITKKLTSVSDVYAEKFSINRDSDWYLLKIQEELGELTQQHLKSTSRGRTDKSNQNIRKNLEDELADVFAMTLLYAEKNNIDVRSALEQKWFRYLNNRPEQEAKPK